MRKDQTGLATKVAKLFEVILLNVNQTHGLDQYPVTLKDTMASMQEGGPILDECKKVAQNEIMAQSHVNLVSGSGRAHTSAILGNMATQNQNGKLSTKEVADLTGRSETWIRKCRLAVENNGLGAFGSTSKSGHHKARMLCPTRLDPELGECTTKDCPLLHDCQCCKDGSQCSAAICKKWDTTKALRADKARVKRISKLSRKTCEDAEVVATKNWMTKENPARSGDQKEICWMVKGRFDFYHENYRTVSAQLEIIKTALDLFGDGLRKKATAVGVRDKWLRNVGKYLDSLREGETQDLKLPTPINEGQVDYDDILQEVLRIQRT